MTTLIIFIIGIIFVIYLWYRSRAAKGLDQWPNPHGPWYDRWMSLGEGTGGEEAGDYYDWLSKKMDHREPWKSWAETERQMSQHKK